LADYIAAEYGAVLLVELSDAELQAVHQLVARWAAGVRMPFEGMNSASSISHSK
jgi:hypothetical protein